MLPNAKTRLTVMVPDSLHRRLKIVSAERRTSMKELVESALKIYVLGTHNATTSQPQARRQARKEEAV